MVEEFAADLFIFQCCTSVSYSDMMGLRYTDIVEVEERFWIMGYRNKTKVRFVIPVLDITMRLIDKYKTIDIVS